jgi:hypothetical protein
MVSSVSAGSSPRTSATRFWSCCSAPAMSLLGSNWAETSVAPRKVSERTRRMPGTSMAACSIGRVTDIIMVRAGSEPLWAITIRRGNWSGG